jgi:hypothetical protein
MAWTYSQSSGNLTDPDGVLAGQGYSGNGADLDNPAGQGDVGHGPIPQGDWTIGAFFDDPGGKGPVVAHLTPNEGTETFGRSGFMIHGDNSEMNHTASEGCIILARTYRKAIAASGDSILSVTP